MKIIRENIFLIFLFFFTLFIVFFFTDHHINSDAIARFEAVKLLITSGEFSDTPYSMIGPLFSIPLWFLGIIFKTPAWWLERYNFLLFLFLLVSLWFIAKKNVEQKVLLITIFILSSLSLFIPYQKNYMGEIFTASFVGIGILLLASKKSLGWLLIILGVANTPATLISFGFVSLYMIWKDKRLHYIIYPCLAFLLILLESYIRRGSFFSTGYEMNAGFQTILPYSGQPGFSYPFVLGLISILFSFGKGLIFFFPGLWFIGHFNKLKKDSVIYLVIILSLIFLLGEILVYSKWWSWYGGLYWGPRFFLIASIPSSFLLAGSILNSKKNSFFTNIMIFTAILLSGWVVISGTIDLKNLSICSQDNFAMEFLCWYVPEFSPLSRTFIETSALVAKDIIFILWIGFSTLYLSFPVIKSMLSKTLEFIKISLHDLNKYKI